MVGQFVAGVLSKLVGDCIEEVLDGKISKERIIEQFTSININELNIIINDYKSIKEKTKPEQEKEIEKIFRNDYATGFAKRLDIIMDLMNYGKNDKDQKINLAKLSKHLGFTSENELRKYYSSNEEPKYDFIKLISESLGVNNEWMSGLDTQIGPFYDKDFNKNYASAYIKAQAFYDKLKYDSCEYLFALNDIEQEPELIIIRKINDFKYETCQEPCLLYDSKGGSGRGKLIATYKLLKRMKKDKKSCGETICVLDNEMFDYLKFGRIYPGSINKFWDRNYNHLIDCFIDLTTDNLEFCKERYKEPIYNAMVYLLNEKKNNHYNLA